MSYRVVRRTDHTYAYIIYAFIFPADRSNKSIQMFIRTRIRINIEDKIRQLSISIKSCTQLRATHTVKSPTAQWHWYAWTSFYRVNSIDVHTPIFPFQIESVFCCFGLSHKAHLYVYYVRICFLVLLFSSLLLRKDSGDQNRPFHLTNRQFQSVVTVSHNCFHTSTFCVVVQALLIAVCARDNKRGATTSPIPFFFVFKKKTNRYSPSIFKLYELNGKSIGSYLGENCYRIFRYWW